MIGNGLHVTWTINFYRCCKIELLCVIRCNMLGHRPDNAILRPILDNNHVTCKHSAGYGGVVSYAIEADARVHARLKPWIRICIQNRFAISPPIRESNVPEHSRCQHAPMHRSVDSTTPSRDGQGNVSLVRTKRCPNYYVPLTLRTLIVFRCVTP